MVKVLRLISQCESAKYVDDENRRLGSVKKRWHAKLLESLIRFQLDRSTSSSYDESPRSNLGDRLLRSRGLACESPFTLCLITNLCFQACPAQKKNKKVPTPLLRFSICRALPPNAGAVQPMDLDWRNHATGSIWCLRNAGDTCARQCAGQPLECRRMDRQSRQALAVRGPWLCLRDFERRTERPVEVRSVHKSMGMDGWV